MSRKDVLRMRIEALEIIPRTRSKAKILRIVYPLEVLDPAEEFREERWLFSSKRLVRQLKPGELVPDVPGQPPWAHVANEVLDQFYHSWGEYVDDHEGRAPTLGEMHSAGFINEEFFKKKRTTGRW